MKALMSKIRMSKILMYLCHASKAKILLKFLVGGMVGICKLEVMGTITW